MKTTQILIPHRQNFFGWESLEFVAVSSAEIITHIVKTGNDIPQYDGAVFHQPVDQLRRQTCEPDALSKNLVGIGPHG
ncbi:hypothetical protein D3C72_524290 [compost metagenome]